MLWDTVIPWSVSPTGRLVLGFLLLLCTKGAVMWDPAPHGVLLGYVACVLLCFMCYVTVVMPSLHVLVWTPAFIGVGLMLHDYWGRAGAEPGAGPVVRPGNGHRRKSNQRKRR